ncbi:hypothetical protein N7G274_004853 [Stereocaulon virgatum]|uniref:Uncharacterized protein n=1 Tax=Stereocaulon virgatum TaxID=373712 RepID=A0ABR4ACD9_9LECA
MTTKMGKIYEKSARLKNDYDNQVVQLSYVIFMMVCRFLSDSYWELGGQTFERSRPDNSGPIWNITNILHGKEQKPLP